MNTFVSMTTRPRAVGTQDLVEFLVGQTRGRSLCGNGLAQIQERLGVPSSQALIVSHRQDHSNVAVLAANDDGFALRIVDERAEAVLGFRGCDCLHVPIIAILAKIANQQIQSGAQLPRSTPDGSEPAGALQSPGDAPHPPRRPMQPRARA